MPERPEMQALGERLAAAFAGATLDAVDAFQFSALKTVAPAPAELRGRTLEGIDRRGKFLRFDFGTAHLLLHLSQGGRVDVEDPPKKTKPKGAVLRLRFQGAPSVLVKEFGTERKAAWWVLQPDDPGPLERLGPEPDSVEFASFVLGGEDKRRLHTMLRDQRTVAGIGRGYADDILNRARLGPFDRLSSLDEGDRRRLLDAILEVLDEGTEAERARRGGLPPKLGDRFAVHGRFGQPCPRCTETLKRVSYESYEITYCSNCQTQGKTLADRRLSRLLK